MSTAALRFHPEPKSFNDFAKAIVEVVKTTGRTASEAVTYAAIRFAQSGKNATPKAKAGTKRDLIPVAVNPDSKSKGKPWLIRVRKQRGQPDKLLPTANQNDPRRLVKNVGAARNSWFRILAGLGKTSVKMGNGKGVSAGKVAKDLRGSNPSVTIMNALSYLYDIAPDIEDEAGRKAAKALLLGIE